MFHRVGKKIKVIAKVVAWIGIISWALIGLLMLLGSTDVIRAFADAGVPISSGSPFALLITAVLIASVGAFSSYLSSLFLYGFGQLIDNSDRLVEDEDDAPVSRYTPAAATAKDASPKTMKKWLKSGLITKKEYKEMLRK